MIIGKWREKQCYIFSNNKSVQCVENNRHVKPQSLENGVPTIIEGSFVF